MGIAAKVAGGGRDLQHRQIAFGGGSDQPASIRAVVGQRDLERHAARLAFHHVVVGDDVAVLVPHEARARPFRNAADVQPEEVALHGQAGDEHHGGRGVLEQLDGRLLVLGQVPACRHHARHRVLPVPASRRSAGTAPSPQSARAGSRAATACGWAEAAGADGAAAGGRSPVTDSRTGCSSVIPLSPAHSRITAGATAIRSGKRNGLPPTSSRAWISYW